MGAKPTKIDAATDRALDELIDVDWLPTLTTAQLSTKYGWSEPQIERWRQRRPSEAHPDRRVNRLHSTRHSDGVRSTAFYAPAWVALFAHREFGFPLPARLQPYADMWPPTPPRRP